MASDLHSSDAEPLEDLVDQIVPGEEKLTERSKRKLELWIGGRDGITLKVRKHLVKGLLAKQELRELNAKGKTN